MINSFKQAEPGNLNYLLIFKNDLLISTMLIFNNVRLIIIN